MTDGIRLGVAVSSWLFDQSCFLLQPVSIVEGPEGGSQCVKGDSTDKEGRLVRIEGKSLTGARYAQGQTLRRTNTAATWGPL